MGAVHFEVHEGLRRLRRRFYWRLVGANGERVAQSEPYSRREDARRGAGDLVRAVGGDTDIAVMDRGR